MGRSAFYGALLGGIWLAGVVVVVLWAATAPSLSWRQGVALVLLLAGAVLALLAWRSVAVGALCWTGGCWEWHPDSGTAAPRLVSVLCCLDLQNRLLVRLQEAAQPVQWAWLEEQRHPLQWRDVRRAVFSHARLPAAVTSSAGLSA